MNDFLLISGAATNKTYVEDYLRSCRKQIPTKTSLVCFREDSDEIVGLNITYVTHKNDPFWKNVKELVKFIVCIPVSVHSFIIKLLQAQSVEYKKHMKITQICRGNVDIFEKYNVSKCLGCICLSVAPKYRGLGIGQRLLEAR